jgi:membrane protein involved in colicin uptake
MEQLQHRITQFQDSYPRIEKFYSQYSKVVTVDETISDSLLDEEQLYYELSRAIETHVDEEQAKIRKEEEEKQREENERLAKEQEEQEAKIRAEEEAARAQEAAEAVKKKKFSSNFISLFLFRLGCCC